MAYEDAFQRLSNTTIRVLEIDICLLEERKKGPDLDNNRKKKLRVLEADARPLHSFERLNIITSISGSIPALHLRIFWKEVSTTTGLVLLSKIDKTRVRDETKANLPYQHHARPGTSNYHCSNPCRMDRHGR